MVNLSPNEAALRLGELKRRNPALAGLSKKQIASRQQLQGSTEYDRYLEVNPVIRGVAELNNAFAGVGQGAENAIASTGLPGSPTVGRTANFLINSLPEMGVLAAAATRKPHSVAQYLGFGAGGLLTYNRGIAGDQTKGQAALSALSTAMTVPAAIGGSMIARKAISDTPLVRAAGNVLGQLPLDFLDISQQGTGSPLREC
jgi:hypothetical protein